MPPPAARAFAPRALRLRRNLAYSMADAFAFSFMVGGGEVYLPAFALALQMGETVAGLLAALPLLVGALLQLVSPFAVRTLGSYKHWVILCASIQACVFVPLVAAAVRGSLSVAAVFLLVATYWGAALATGPAWNTWIEQLVPRPIRAHYFARRNRLGQMGLLAGIVGGGALLQLGRGARRELAAFAVLFAAAGVSRLASVLFLTRQHEERRSIRADRQLSLWVWARRLKSSSDGRLLVYLLAMQTAVYVAGPYFTPYMLHQLSFSYVTYMGLLSVSLVTKILCLPAIGLLGRRIGAHRLLWLGGAGIVPMSATWLVSDNLVYLSLIQVASGVTWAAYELATVLIFFETIRADERVSMLTFFNLANAAALVVGSAIGGLLLHGLGETRVAYGVLFALSCLLRGASLLLLPKADKIRAAQVPIDVTTLTVRADVGGIARPMLPGLRDTPDRERG